MQKEVNQPRGGLKFDQSFENTVNNRWETYYNEAKKSMTCPENEKDDILRKRILKFFQDYHIHTDNYYVERRQVSYQNIDTGLIFQDSLMIFGIDFLSIERLRSYFNPYQVKISLYDDSHCSVAFESIEMLVECLFSRLLQSFEHPKQLLDFFIEKPKEMIIWRQIRGYKEMMFNRKMFARFLVKQDDVDENNGSYGRKMMTFFQKAKRNFLEQMEKNVYNKSGIRENFRKKFGRGWKSETNTSSCSNCEEKMERMKEMFPCNHKGFSKKPVKKEQEDEENEKYPISRRIKTKKRYRQKNDDTFSEVPKVQPIIEQITGQGLSQIIESPSISSSKGLYDNMLKELERHNISGIELKDEVLSEPGGSFFSLNESGL